MIENIHKGKSTRNNMMKYQSENKLTRSKTKAYESSDQGIEYN